MHKYHSIIKWKRIWIPVALALLALFLAIAPVVGQSTGPTKIWLPVVVRSQTSTNPIHTGIATYYYATGSGACLFGASPSDLMVAAMNGDEYDNSSYCGGYVRVKGPKGEVTVRIVDLCPGCEAGHLDLSQEAFARIANLPQGRVSIQWQVVSPSLSGPIVYQFKDGSNRWWTAVQIRNHRNPIRKLEYQNSNKQWVNVPRTSYNYFVEESGMGSGPYTFRVTDWYGNVLVDKNIPLPDGGSTKGASQFPPGP